jgi:hypothetical protein
VGSRFARRNAALRAHAKFTACLQGTPALAIAF